MLCEGVILYYERELIMRERERERERARARARARDRERENIYDVFFVSMCV